jgi:putative ABC transport system permease protein
MEFEVADIEAIRRQIPEAAAVCPRNQLGRGFQGGNEVSRGTKSSAFSVVGDFPEIARVQSVRLVAGRFLNPYDLAERRKVAVIGSRVQEVLFQRGENPLGEHIRIKGVDFKVIGVFKPRRSGNGGDNQDQTIFLPFTTFQSAFNFGQRVGWFAITSSPGVPASEMEKKVLALLKERHGVAPNDERALGHFNLETEFKQVQGLFAGIETLIWIVGVGTLAAGIIGVSNIMLVIVRERTNEIGVRRAVGATPMAIMAQVIFEATVLTGVAGCFGLVAGVGLVEATNRLTAGADMEMFRNPEVSFDTAVQTLLILMLCGVLAGLFPARRAVKVSPVEALRAVV